MPSDKDDNSLPKVVKLNGSNYHEWKEDIKMILIMKGYWRALLEDKPPRDKEEVIGNWENVQEQCLAVIYLSCERDQKHLISEAETGAGSGHTISVSSGDGTCEGERECAKGHHI